MRETIADKRISFAVAYYFTALAANATMKNILNVDEGFYSLISAFWGISIILFLARAFKYVYKRNKRMIKNCYVLASVMLIISIILSILRGEPYDLMISSSFFPFLIWFLPIGLCVSSVNNKQILYETILKGANAIAFLMLLFFIYREKENQYGAATYNMTFGLTLVTPAIIHLNEFIRTKKKNFLIVFIIEFIALVLYGNRAILLNIVFYIIYKYIFDHKDKKVIVRNLFVFTMMGLVMIGAAQSILLSIGDMMTTYGIQSRTLTMLTGESILESSERLDLWDISFKMIGEKPFIGYGFGGEYYQIASKYGGDISEASSAFHPHNGILQLLINFGVICGLLMTFLCIKPFFGLRRKVRDNTTFDLILIFGSYLMPKLYSASGILISPEIAIFLFLYYSYHKNIVICPKL